LRSITALVNRSAKETVMDISKGNYCGGRKSEDGRIHWSQPAGVIHNLIRAVAPPYPGAFFEIDKHRIEILGSYYRDLPAPEQRALNKHIPRIYQDQDALWAECIDGKRFRILAMKVDGQTCNAHQFSTMFGTHLLLRT
jgi:methionyl-tRNA formyltransferase